MFYIYEWYIVDTNEIIYVGKGSKKRYLCKQHNKMFKEFLNRYECKSRIVEYFENEQEAYQKEYDRIKELKEINQCVCNIYDGGHGGGASINHLMNRWTEESREKYSKNNVMKSKSQRERMSKENPMKNPEIAKIVGEKHRKPFYIGNKKFQTLKEASKHYEICESSIAYWLKVGHNKTNLCYYINEKPIQYDFTKNNHITTNIKVLYDDKEYNSIKELANFLNMEYTKVHKYYKKGKEINGKIITRQSATKPQE